jgi:hypothetical protein
MATLGPEQLEKAWQYYINIVAVDYQPPSYYIPTYKHYGSVSKYKKGFHDWLWEQGGYVKRSNKEYYLDFPDEQLVIFMLRYL